MAQRKRNYERYGQAFKNNPYTTYAAMREDEAIMQVSGYQGNMWFVTGYEEAKQVLSDHKHFVKDYANTLQEHERVRTYPESDLATFLNHNLLTMDKPDHTRLRAIVSTAFTNKRITELEPRIQEIANELIDDLPENGDVDLIDAYAFPLPIIVICELLGVPVKDRDKFRVWSNAFIGAGDYGGSYFMHMMNFFQYVQQIVAERRKLAQDDLISALIHAEEDGEKLTQGEIYSMIALLIVAGHETTVNLIANGLFALLQHPDQLALLKQNPDLTVSAIEEFLRYDSPVEIATTRYVAKDVEIGGHVIKRGATIIVSPGAANRDGAQFERPDQLDITRNDNKHLGFGYGVHYCLGAPLARLEGKIAINTLLEAVPDIQLAVSASKLNYRNSPVVRGLEKLPVKWSSKKK